MKPSAGSQRATLAGPKVLQPWKQVRLYQVRALRGPNVHAHNPVLEALIDIGPYEQAPSNHFPGLVDRLTGWLPGLHEHVCGLGHAGGFIERLQEGTYLGHMTEHIGLELQGLMGFEVHYGKTRGIGKTGHYRIVMSYIEEEPARAALDCALRLVLAAMHDLPFDCPGELSRLQHLGSDYALGPSTGAIAAAARARDIPITRLEATSGLLQLGWGVHQQRVQAAETGRTSNIGVELCQDKPLTKELLDRVGVPVPHGRIVTSPADAVRAAKDLAGPVVVKPRDGNQGKGVSTGLTDPEAVRAAYTLARRYGNVIVEQHLEGQDYRLLVVNGRMVAAARRDPPFIVGDGIRSVAALIDELNDAPERGDGHGAALTRVVMDAAVTLTLAQQGLAGDSVPGPGQVVYLRRNANLSTGGSATDVTDDVHPDNRHTAELAARVMGLDIAGIDIVCSDIAVPLSEQGGGIVEVNAAPGLRMHVSPSRGLSRDVGGAIVQMLYPDGGNGRIPVLAVTGTNGKTSVSWLLERLYSRMGYTVGLTSTEGIQVGGRQIVSGDCSGPASARTVLFHPEVEVAVLETARGGILREGLGFDRCDVGVVLNVTADHMGLGGIETLEDLAKVKRVVAESVRKDGVAVLNAEDPLVAAMAEKVPGEVIYFSTDPSHPVVERHLAAGGRCALLQDRRIVLTAGADRRAELMSSVTAAMPDGRISFRVQNLLAVAAAAWGARVPLEVLGEFLSQAAAEVCYAPGRMEVHDLDGVEVILDYAHNQAALTELGHALRQRDQRRTIMLLGLPGDRRDVDLVASAAATGEYVDAHILYDLEDRRDRRPGEVPELMQSVLGNKVLAVTADQSEAFDEAWRHLLPGDRLVVVVDTVESARELLERRERIQEPTAVTTRAQGGD